MRSTLLAVSLLAGCAPAEAMLDGASSIDTVDAPTLDTGDNSVADGDTDADEPEPEPEPEPEITMVEGGWEVVDVTLLEDVCEWDAALKQFGDKFSLTSFMPSVFDVESEAGLFQIEARDYGAQGPIDCEIDGDRFFCEAQTVSPLAYSLGRSGWEYRIEWSGEVEDEETLIGKAVVSYPSVDQGTDQALQYYGIDFGECTQTIELVLSAE